jgi:photosystem II stability/assembly factor-like uncharacterized protein
VTLAAPNGTSLRAAWGPDGSHVYIVGGGDETDSYQGTYPGTIMFFNGTTAIPLSGLPQTCSGQTMAGMVVPTSCTLNSVWGTDATHIWAVGDTGYIVSTSDGTTWTQQQNIGTQFNLNGVWGTGPNDIYVVGEGGTLLHYDGQSWQSQATGTNVNLLSVWGMGNDLYLTGYSGAVLHRQLP